jgi:ATP-dependent DNA helicase RecG
MSAERARDLPLTELRGVGPARAARLEALGVGTLGELALLLPRGLEPSGRRLRVAEVLEAGADTPVVVSGEVARRSLRRFGRRSTLRLVVARDGAELEVVYFNQPWQRERFEPGSTWTFAGRVARGERGTMLVAPRSAEGEASLPADVLEPRFPRVAGLGPEAVRDLVRAAQERVLPELEERLDPAVLARLELPALGEAARELVTPSSPEGFDAACRRLRLEELLPLQARVLARAAAARGAGAARIAPGSRALRAFLDALPFELTGGQREVLAHLEADLARGAPMRRLLQGDVGSGKTALGLAACAAVAGAGGQAAFLAPTELLAEQHLYGAREALARAGVRAGLLTGSLPAARRRAVREALAAGELDLVFGTHALFSPAVRYARLDLAVIDEQHRFGVAQRRRLVEKGGDAHLLLMTATPIPRTLALTLYGDLEVSCLRERPPGRGELRTRWLRPGDRRRLPAFLRERLSAGERVYWVVPRIGDEEAGGAERVHARLRRSKLAAHGVELVHGRLPAEERAARLDRFRRGEARLLVATTVIEVGVDVPEATVMVVEEAERLGLAQLHQLRGRVGRGERESWCLLHGREAARERFLLLERCADGFELAEEDLARRGMGELAGLRQSGEAAGLEAAGPELLLAARDLLLADPELARSLAAGTAAGGA